MLNIFGTAMKTDRIRANTLIDFSSIKYRSYSLQNKGIIYTNFWHTIVSVDRKSRTMLLFYFFISSFLWPCSTSESIMCGNGSLYTLTVRIRLNFVIAKTHNAQLATHHVDRDSSNFLSIVYRTNRAENRMNTRKKKSIEIQNHWHTMMSNDKTINKFVKLLVLFYNDNDGRRIHKSYSNVFV